MNLVYFFLKEVEVFYSRLGRLDCVKGPETEKKSSGQNLTKLKDVDLYIEREMSL